MKTPEIDFTGFHRNAQQPQEAQTAPEQPEPFSARKEPQNERDEPQNAPELIKRRQAELMELAEARRVYQAYQSNIRDTEQLTVEILGDIRAGADVYSLFLKAARALSIAIQNDAFYNQVERETREIYGGGLGYKPALIATLHDTQERRRKLGEAGEQPDAGRSLAAAIADHDALIAQIEKRIADGES